MQIVVQLKLARARLLHSARGGIAQSVVSGVVLQPMHPGTNDPDLMRFFTVEVSDSASAEQLIARLQQDAEVEAAYLKPPDEMPGRGIRSRAFLMEGGEAHERAAPRRGASGRTWRRAR